MLRRLLTSRPLTSLSLLLALGVAVFYAEENWRGRRAWEKWRAAAEKRGAGIFLTDFVPPAIPDSENFAEIPLIREVFVPVPAGESSSNPFCFPVDSQGKAKQPKAPSDAEERRFDAAGWRDYFLQLHLLMERTDSAPADVLRALERYASAMQQIRAVAPRPRCRFPVQWGDAWSVRLPHYTVMQALGRLLSIRIGANFALGRNADALEDFRLGLRVFDAVATEPSLIAALTRISILSMMEMSVWDGLAARGWSDAELAAIESSLTSLRLGADCRFALASERGFGNSHLLKIVGLSSSEVMDASGAALFSNGLERYHTWAAIHFYPRGWLWRVLVRYNEYFDWLIARSEMLTAELPPTGLPSYQDSPAWFAIHPTHAGVEDLESVLMLNFQQVFDHAFRKYLFLHTRTEETRLACALERFRHAKGAFPKKLAELLPDFLPAIPRDLFDGQPLRYRLNPDGGYDLWSIGPDRTDGGGLRGSKNLNELADDWIWHLPGLPAAK